MINIHDPSRPFISYINQQTGANTAQVVEGTKSLPSEADGVAETNLQPFFTVMSKVAAFARDAMKAHPELRDNKPSIELQQQIEQQMKGIQGEAEALPKPAQDLGKQLFEAAECESGLGTLSLIPTEVTPGPPGMFAITVSRVGDDYRDKAPEPYGVGEPRKRIFVDITPGIEGIQFFAQDLTPTPRPEFLQRISLATGRLPEAVARDVKMFNASTENPIKSQIGEALEVLGELAASGLASAASGDSSKLSDSDTARLEELSKRASTLDEQAPKLQNVMQELFQPVTKAHPGENTLPTRIVIHADGTYSIEFVRPGSSDNGQPVATRDGGWLYIDTRPGQPGYSSYYQPDADGAAHLRAESWRS